MARSTSQVLLLQPAQQCPTHHPPVQKDVGTLDIEVENASAVQEDEASRHVQGDLAGGGGDNSNGQRVAGYGRDLPPEQQQQQGNWHPHFWLGLDMAMGKLLLAPV